MPDILEAYVGRLFCHYVLLVLLALSALFLFVDVIDQIGDIGKYSFTFWHSLALAALHLQQLLPLLIPIAAMIGGMACFGVLANNGELMVMRCSGTSRLRLALGLTKYALIFILLQMIHSETVAPWALHHAREMRTELLRQPPPGTRHFWIRQGNQFTVIMDMPSDSQINGIDVYDFGPDRTLLSHFHAHRGEYRDERWILHDVVQTELQEKQVYSQKLSLAMWDTRLAAAMIAPGLQRPDELSTLQILRHLPHLRATEQDITLHLQTLFKRILQPLSVIVMLLLAMAIINPASRGVSLGRHIAGGCLIGVIWYIASEISGNLGLVVPGLSLAGSMLFPYVPLLAFIGWRLSRSN